MRPQDDRNNNMAIAAATLVLNITRQQVLLMKRKKKKRLWVKEWLQKYGHRSDYETIYVEWRVSDQERFRRVLRLSTEAFDCLLHLVRPFIERQETNMRQPISAGKRLACTLRFLATGESYYSLSGTFCIGHSTVSELVPEVCRAISFVLSDYTRKPNSEDEWKAVAQQYWERWDYPNCIGALDGKHILIQPPPGSGADFHNYKGTFSQVLMALVDADLRFIFADVGTNGRISDGGVWGRCDLKKALDQNTMHVPDPTPLPGTDTVIPYHIVGDEAFSLGMGLMRPFSGKEIRGEFPRRIFNYRLSRARRTSENCFGVFVHRFEVFRSPLRTATETTKSIVLACVALHNWLITNRVHRAMYAPHQYLDHDDILTGEVHRGQWRHGPNPAGIHLLAHQGGNRIRQDAKQMREELCHFVNGTGSREWQERMIV